MKSKFLVVCVLIIFTTITTLGYAQGQIPSAPTQNNFVVDQFGWFTPDQITYINNISAKLALDKNTKIYVATLTTCGNGNIVSFSQELSQSWKLANTDTLIFLCSNGSGNLTLHQAFGKTNKIPESLRNQVPKIRYTPIMKVNDNGITIKSSEAALAIVAIVTDYDQILRDVIPSEYLPRPANPNRGTQILMTPICGIPLAFWLVIGIISVSILGGFRNASKAK